MLFSNVILKAQIEPPKDEDVRKYIKCSLGTKYSVDERRKMFPFSEAKKIVLIAFKNHDVLLTTKKVVDTIITSKGERKRSIKQIDLDICNEKEVVKNWDLRDIGKFKTKQYCALENIELIDNQIDTLSNILFNYQLNLQPTVLEKPGCYTPRNAILYVDKKNKVIAIVEICFECAQIYFSFDKNEGTLDCYCSERQKALKAFFYTIGIKYGIDSH
jgi:hypothetical protein